MQTPLNSWAGLSPNKNHATSKKDALAHIVLVANQYKLTSKMIECALEAAHKKANPIDKYMRLFAYLGSILIFVGIILYVGMFWSQLSSITRVLLIFIPGLLLYSTGILLPLYHKGHDNMITPLFLLATVFQSLGLFIALNEFNISNNIRLALFSIFGVMFIQQMITFRHLKNYVVLFLSLFFGSLFMASSLDLLYVKDQWIQLFIGVSILITSYLIDKTRFRSIVNFWYFVGAVIFLNGLFDIVKHTYAEGIFFLMGLALLYLSTLIRNKILLFVSALSTIAYLAYFTHNHFMHSVAWPMILVMMGIVCFGVGILVLKLSKKYMSSKES